MSDLIDRERHVRLGAVLDAVVRHKQLVRSPHDHMELTINSALDGLMVTLRSLPAAVPVVSFERAALALDKVRHDDLSPYERATISLAAGYVGSVSVEDLKEASAILANWNYTELAKRLLAATEG